MVTLHGCGKSDEQIAEESAAYDLEYENLELQEQLEAAQEELEALKTERNQQSFYQSPYNSSINVPKETIRGENGEIYTQSGNTFWGADGKYYNKVGTSLMGSDGSYCYKAGNTYYCDK